MGRIGLAVVVALSLVLAPLAAEAERAGKVWRIGYLTPFALPNPPDRGCPSPKPHPIRLTTADLSRRAGKAKEIVDHGSAGGKGDSMGALRRTGDPADSRVVL